MSITKNILCVAVLIAMLASCKEKVHPNVLSEEKVTESFSRDGKYKLPADFDIQGHRGARGLYPENTMFGMISAVGIKGLTTLEMDVVISKDRQVVLSHEPWMSSDICSFSNDDRLLPFDDEKYRIYDMKYEEVKKFDCGSRWLRQFPKQRVKSQYKPLLKDIILEVREYSAEQKLPDVAFNIEIKSRPEWDNFMTPDPAEFARLVYDVIKNSEVMERITIQSFDVRSLKAMRALDPSVRLVLLVEDEVDYKKKLAELDFVPFAYSPNYKLIDKQKVAEIRQLGMKVIPWTVNDSIQMMKVIEMGVDGIISDDPKLLVEVADKYR